MSLRPLGSYRYHNPAIQPPADPWVVMPIQPTPVNLQDLPAEYRSIARDALSPQATEGPADPDFTPAEGPYKHRRVIDEAKRLADLISHHNDECQAVRLVPIATQSWPQPEAWPQAEGIGVAEELPTSHDTNQTVMADLSAVYVRSAVQSQGKGLSIWYSLLDAFAPDTPVAVYNRWYREGSRRDVILRQLGLMPTQQWKIDQYEQVMYTGPTAGEMRQTLRNRQPWLAERVPYVPERLRLDA